MIVFDYHNHTIFNYPLKMVRRYRIVCRVHIISKQNDESFVKSLNEVKEGFVLYNGAIYSPALANLKTWNKELIIYIGTEHIFFSTGYNGLLFKQIFDDASTYDLNFSESILDLFPPLCGRGLIDPVSL